MKNNFLILFSIFFIHLNLYSSETLTFSKAYTLSLKNSEKVKSLDYKLKASYENIVQAKSKRYPEINLYSSYTQNDYKFVNKSIKQMKQKVRDYSVILQQPIFDKTINSQVKVENSKFKSLNAEIKGMKQDLANDILKIYLSLIESKNKIKMLLLYKQNLKYKIDLLEEQYSMNLSTQTEVLEIKIELNQVNVDLEKEKLLYKVNKKKLQTLMGDNRNFRVPDLNNLEYISNNLVKLKKIVNTNNEIYSNLQIKKLMNIVKMYKYQVKRNRYNHLPKINLSLEYTKNVAVENNLSFDSSFDEDKEIGLNIVIPLFKGGYYDSLTTASKLNVKASQKELNSLINQLKSEYKENKTTLLWTIKSVKLYTESLETAILSKDSIQKEYKYGVKSIIDLYDAKYKIFKIKEEYIKNIFTLVDTYLSLLILTNNFEDLKSIDLILKD